MNASLMKNLLLILGIVLAAGGGYLASRLARDRAQPVVVQGATLLNDTRSVPDFSLKKAGGSFSVADLRGHWTFVFFGYTHCPDVCPTALSLMKDVRTRLAAAGHPLPQVVFVSVDPGRDTVEVLGQYVPAFDPSFVGITGDDLALAPLIKHFGVFFQRNQQGASLRYTVDHSAGIYLVDPEARLKAVFMPPVAPEQMTSDYISIIRR